MNSPFWLKRWSQSNNDTQLWIGLVMEVKSNDVKSNIAPWAAHEGCFLASGEILSLCRAVLPKDSFVWGEEDFQWARGLSHVGQWRKQLPINQVITTSKESLLECSECLWSKPRGFTLCSSSPEIPARFPLHSRNVQGCSSNN